ncbi:hypothetical protein GT037_003340 [Alternaria burnsii]|uniref:Uncharacterized protein n=1 Tax=Alternaria burnsii TaxID=1187904 RepID=A0A8H7BCQ7_9PLEO|nr:uncharacterized protein GT037_003340 [Alternaria burnsii]KAF7679592.1 hypothetical protein GT037_003340 [Alternaria burnsii]
MRAFGTEAYVEKWVPAMMSHPHVLLSAVFLVCNWLDMLEGLPGESTRTGLVRAEIMHMLRERVQNSHMYDTASTIIIIVHLLAGEIWRCDESILRIHVSGIAKLITLCGGMVNFEKAYVAELSASCCFQCDLVCEAKPLSTLISWQPLDYAADDDISIPESPLFCPRVDFMTVPNDERCSPSICNLLRDMRDLTDLFISKNAANEVESDLADVSAAYLSSTGPDYSTKVAGIRERLALLPSADLPGHQGTGDWVYEACRLTAMIYTASIVCRLPLSIAAHPSQNLLWAAAESLREPHDRQILLTTHLSELLLQALERTDLANVWNGMAGVLYWITTVGAAAARTTVIPTMLQRPLYSKPCKPRVRQCLAMYSMRTFVLLGFKHQMPILLSQKRLFRVQELIGTYG